VSDELLRTMSVIKVFKTGISLRQFAPALVLTFNSLVWYTLMYALFTSTVNRLSLSVTLTFALYGVYYGGFALSAVVGAVFFPRAREKCLLVWMLLGTLATVLLPSVESNSLPVNVLVSLFLGVSVGVGLPSSLAYFADTTSVENRGRCGGVIWGAIGFSVLGLALFINVLGTFEAFMALAIWRAAGLLVFYVLSRIRGKLEVQPSTSSYRRILGRRDVTLYLLPWLMFSLVNFAESPILGNLFGDFQVFVGFIEFAIAGFFAIVGGILADSVGRKRVVITGFVILGIEYAALSLFSAFEASWYVYTVCDGMAWGMFASVFFMTLWGDLAEDGQKEKYYVLGGLPYLLAGFLPVLVKPFVGGIETVTAFSLASFFLFLAVLPLMYAPETLPEKKIKELELRSYAERAKKIKDKYA
jgi:MFS family permease